MFLHFKLSPQILETTITRLVCWFICGAASVVVTKLAIKENNNNLPVVIAYTEVIEEHEDNKRFIADCRIVLNINIITYNLLKFFNINL